ncbi:permease [Nocardioides jiangxiensis]|uniref:Permease n=1 Tax=Nocardioides jiangxiensis TaxID=3064524 RepID=A0ABT9AXL6_9ACTN|nr:permease [Nocardioides sp. WY-20]MDO7867023.1 permease [Nocardioides sp. WY-20]
METVWEPFRMAAAMGWEILWPLILGFALSGVVQAVVRRDAVVARLSGDSPRALLWATGLGAASSSCSYAAVALARSLFRKGASLTAAMAFEIASTNLVVELGIILWLLMGWQFTLAEFIGGPVMIVVVAVFFRLWMRGRVIEAAHAQAEKGLLGAMEGHAAMDMSVGGPASFWRRLFSPKGFTAVAHFYVMDWASVARDILIGLLIAGVFAAWVPTSWLESFFLSDSETWAPIWGPVVGPLVAVVSFVCSIGNVPLAAVLWNGGISFGGVISFLFADLLVVPILVIYRRYYGTAAALRITGFFYLAMVIAGYAIEVLFGAAGLTPEHRSATVMEAGFTWNYTTWLNLAFLALSTALVWRFFRTGGPAMLQMMRTPPPAEHHHHAHAPE